MTKRSSAGAALTLALALAACGRPPASVQPEPSGRVGPAAAPGSLLSVSTAPSGSGGGSGNGSIESVAFQSDGKMVTAGRSNDDRFLVARYTADGSLDTSFSGDGLATTDFAGPIELGRAVRIQPDGKIVVAGYATNPDNSRRIAVARYNANGTPDTSFDGDGKLTTSVGGSGSEALEVAISTFGGQTKIVVAGSATATGSNELRFATLRLNAGGGLDKTFNGGGFALSTFSDARVGAVLVQPDGKIVVGGNDREHTYAVMALVRYNVNGSLDAGFGSGGKASHYVVDYSMIDGMTLQPNGKIVAVGYADASYHRVAVARFNANGSLDQQAEISGFTPQTDDERPYAYDAAVQPDGKIVVAGTVGVSDDDPATTNDFFAVARLNPDLSLDTSFGSGGKVATAIGSNLYAAGLRIRLVGDRIKVAGLAREGAGYSENDTSFALAQYFR